MNQTEQHTEAQTALDQSAIPRSAHQITYDFTAGFSTTFIGTLEECEEHAYKVLDTKPSSLTRISADTELFEYLLLPIEDDDLQDELDKVKAELKNEQQWRYDFYKSAVADIDKAAVLLQESFEAISKERDLANDRVSFFKQLHQYALVQVKNRNGDIETLKLAVKNADADADYWRKKAQEPDTRGFWARVLNN